jgi:hypothetical protein
MPRKLARLKSALALAVEQLATHRCSLARQSCAARGRAAAQSWRAGCPAASRLNARQLKGRREGAGLTATQLSSSEWSIRPGRRAMARRPSGREGTAGHAALSGMREGSLRLPCSPHARRPLQPSRYAGQRGRRWLPVIGQARLTA